MHLALFQNPTNAADEKFNKYFSDGPSVAHQVGTRQGHERRKTSAIIDENIGNIPHPLHFFRASTNGLGGVYFDLYEQCASLEYAEKLARSEFQTEILDVVNKKVLIVQP